MSMTYETDAAQMAAEAEEANMGRCINGEAVFFLPGEYGVRAGHIYSMAGKEEFRISHCCEFHFDEMFADPSCDCGQQCCDQLAAIEELEHEANQGG